MAEDTDQSKHEPGPWIWRSLSLRARLINWSDWIVLREVMSDG